MKDDVPAMESGDRDDFKYANDLVYRSVKVDRILRDGDTIKMGEVLRTAFDTPGHTAGSDHLGRESRRRWLVWTLWFSRTAPASIPAIGWRKIRLYAGIADDYRRTHHALEMLKPDIWLAQHNEYYDLEGKAEARTDRRCEGVDLP